LILGVRNDKVVIGLETDFQKMAGKNLAEDDYERLITDNLISNFGLGIRQEIDVQFCKVKNKNLCFIRVNSRASKPVFMKSEDGISKVMFIREGSQCRALTDPEEMFEYSFKRWNYGQTEEINELSFLSPLFRFRRRDL